MYLIEQNKDAILLSIAILGFLMTLRTFEFNLQQRKIENTFKVLDFMRKHIRDDEIRTFVEAFHANNTLAGDPLMFRYEDGREEHLDHFFSEGGSGNGDIHNIIEIFNLVSGMLLRGELKEELVWYEYGQLMLKCHEWTDYLESNGSGKKYYNEVVGRIKDLPLIEKIRFKRFLKPYIDPKQSFSYHFNRYMKRSTKRNLSLAVKHYTYVE